MPLITDYTSIDYNSYYTEAEVDTLVDTLQGIRDISQWSTKTSAEKENLILATVRDIAGYVYQGSLNSSVVAPNMMFPRVGIFYSNGLPVPSNEVPDCVGTYTAYRVLERIDNQDTSTDEVGQNLKRNKLDTLEQEFYNNEKREPSNDPTRLPSFQYIERFIVPGTAGGFNINISRV